MEDLLQFWDGLFVFLCGFLPKFLALFLIAFGDKFLRFGGQFVSLNDQVECFIHPLGGSATAHNILVVALGTLL